MFCPKCLSEYKTGIYVCKDCKVSLVVELPQNHKPEFIEYEEILTTFNLGDIAVIKSLLDSTDIIYYFHGEFFNYMEPLAQPARLMVNREQANEAREILKDLKITYSLSFREQEE